MILKEKKYVFSILIIAFIITALLIFVQSTKTKEEINNSVNNYSEVNFPKNGKNELTQTEQENIIKYLEENISEISPEKEVLGGKFYLTSLDFIDSNNLKVEYEDGHIALMANINFDYLEGDEVRINNFEIVNLD